jgi:hypothetical protein
MYFKNLPPEIVFPVTSLTVQGLSELYQLPVSTFAATLKQLNLHGIFTKETFTPVQQLILFTVYAPPPKYYRAFQWLEQAGYIQELINKYQLENFIRPGADHPGNKLFFN